MGRPRGSRVCLIGDGPTQPCDPGLQIDRWPHTRGGALFASVDSPLARLRLARRRYDLVILGPAGSGVRPNQDLWTRETFRRLAGLAAPAGCVVVRICPTGIRPADLRTVAHTFQKAFNGRAAWLTFGTDRATEAELWLVGRGPAQALTSPLLAQEAGAFMPKPMRALLAGSGPLWVHSAEHHRLHAENMPASLRLVDDTAALLLRTEP